MHITLVNFTDQGIRNVKESPDRYEAFKVLAEQMGLTVVGVYYTIGHYDMVVILEGSDEATTAALLKVGSLGNIRTETMRAYSVEGMRKLVENL
ncbi:MAG: GYD domain-containing protein [Candidatus Thiodiazotropha endolucinida]